MANFAGVLKDEIARLARKEIRAELEVFKKSSQRQKELIAQLRERVTTLEKELKRVGRTSAKTAVSSVGPDGDGPATQGKRFSSKGFASWRAKMKLSAAQVATLLDTTPASVFQWEKGETRPQERFLERIFTVRTLGKREIVARLNSAAPDAN